MQTFVVISNRLIQTYFFSGHPLFHRFNDTVLFTSNKLSLFKSRYVGFNLQVNEAIKAYQTINKLTPRKVNLSDHFPEGGKTVWTLMNNWIYIMNVTCPINSCWTVTFLFLFCISYHFQRFFMKRIWLQSQMRCLSLSQYLLMETHIHCLLPNLVV